MISCEVQKLKKPQALNDRAEVDEQQQNDNQVDNAAWLEQCN